jgi:hypothetical protein
VNGEIRRLPYLGSLRVAPAYRHRIRVLRGGFEAVRSLLHKTSDLPFALTSITADNDKAARVLCAGLPGLPTYRPAGELATFAIRTRERSMPPGIERATTSRPSPSCCNAPTAVSSSRRSGAPPTSRGSSRPADYGSTMS